MQPMPLLSIVIVNYHTRDLVLDLLASIFGTAFGRASEVIVIDNNSGDGCIDAVRERFPNVTAIQNTDNRYFSAAYTQGLRMARGEFLLALNPDTLVRGNALEQMVGALRADPEIGAVTTQLYFPDGTLQRNCQRFPALSDLILSETCLRRLNPALASNRRQRLWYPEWDRNSPRFVDMLPGSCILASRQVWADAGWFNSRMLMYYSDDVFCRNVVAAGRRCAYVLSDGIVHLESQSAKKFSRRAQSLYFRDQITFTRLVFGVWAGLLMQIILIPGRIALWFRQRA